MPLLVQSPALSSLVFRKVCACPREETGMQQYWGEKRDPGKLYWGRLNSEMPSLPEKHMESIRDCMGEITAGGGKWKSWKCQWS